MTSPLIPAEDLPLLASYGRTFSANTNERRPDHVPPRLPRPAMSDAVTDRLTFLCLGAALACLVLALVGGAA